MMTSKYLGMSDKNGRNDSRKQKQRKPKTKLRHYITDSEIRLLRWQCKQSGGGQTSISQKHIGSDIINLAATSIFVGRNIHILWPKRP